MYEVEDRSAKEHAAHCWKTFDDRFKKKKKDVILEKARPCTLPCRKKKKREEQQLPDDHPNKERERRCP